MTQCARPVRCQTASRPGLFLYVRGPRTPKLNRWRRLPGLDHCSSVVVGLASAYGLFCLASGTRDSGFIHFAPSVNSRDIDKYLLYKEKSLGRSETFLTCFSCSRLLHLLPGQGVCLRERRKRILRAVTHFGCLAGPLIFLESILTPGSLLLEIIIWPMASLPPPHHSFFCGTCGN